MNAHINRSIDLLPAMSAPALFPGSSYCIGGFWPVHGGHNGSFSPASVGLPQ
jgi:hypothetical protein